MTQLISIVIPIYFEEQTLEELVNKVLAIELPDSFKLEVVMVNDGSTDRSWEIMQILDEKHEEIKIINQEQNKGKSQTVRTGIAETVGDWVVVQDADFEYEPQEIVDLLNLALENDLDVVYGNRFGKKNKVIYWQNYIGNKFLSFISNLFTYPRIKKWIPDMEVCYKLMRGDIARDVGASIQSQSTFGLEPEVTAKLSKYTKDGEHLKFGVMPISYNPRSIEEGKKMRGYKHGVRALWEIISFNV